MTTLITAESIIAGFMIAYGALNGQMLLYWRNSANHGSPMTTYLVGVWIYAIVITCFASILLLYSSIDTKENDRRYRAGYWLFIWAMFLSGLFVNVGVYSINHFITYNTTVEVSATPWVTVSEGAFYGYVVILIIVGGWVIWTTRKKVGKAEGGHNRQPESA